MNTALTANEEDKTQSDQILTILNLGFLPAESAITFKFSDTFTIDNRKACAFKRFKKHLVCEAKLLLGVCDKKKCELKKVRERIEQEIAATKEKDGINASELRSS